MRYLTMSEPNENCTECTVDATQLLREKIIKNLAECDFVHVLRCKYCREYPESSAIGWCNRYDEPKMSMSYCSEGKPRDETEGISKPGQAIS